MVELHQRIVETTGGAPGIRDLGALESALAQPKAAFAGRDLHRTLAEKAAAPGFSLAKNHPFVDGNKRVGFEAMRLMLRLNGYDLHVSHEAKFDFVMEIAKGKLTEQAIADWLKYHSRPYRRR